MTDAGGLCCLASASPSEKTAKRYFGAQVIEGGSQAFDIARDVDVAASQHPHFH
jgi:hypothetical protein